MIGSSGSVSSSIASVYAANTRSLSEALTRIASGKKFQNASEDLLGFIRSQNLQVNIAGYEKVREDLTSFKSYTSASVDAASTVYEKLTRMRNLAVQYAAAAGDTDSQAEYASEFDALKTEVGSILDNSRVDGDLLSAITTDIIEVNLDPEGLGTLALNFSDNTDSGTVTALDLATGSDDADVQTEIDRALVYLSEAKAYDGIADQQLKLTETIINSKKAVLSLITDIDEAEETNNILDLTIRQQAGIAMLAQGNMLQSGLSKLYE